VALRPASVGRLPHLVGREFERAAGADAGIELADAAGRGCRGWRTASRRAPWPRGSGRRRPTSRGRPRRAPRDAEGGRHVLARLAVAPGRGAREAAVLVDEVDREAVEPWLGSVLDDIRAESLAHPLVERGQFLVAERIVPASAWAWHGGGWPRSRPAPRRPAGWASPRSRAPDVGARAPGACGTGDRTSRRR